jgi:hypothetical protein
VAAQNDQRQMEAVDAGMNQTVWLTWEEESALLLSR